MVSQTVANLMQAVMEELQVVNSGGSITTDETSSFIDRLQRFVDSAGVQKPLLFGEQLNSLALSTNKQIYTIGLDPLNINVADFSVAWPTKIDRANLFLSSTVRRPIHILDAKQWASIRYQQVTGPPQALYFDRNFGSLGGSTSGFGAIYFYFIPDQAYNWEFYSWNQLPSISSTSTLLNYPPGYADFWLYGMCIRAASMFDTEPTPVHIQLYKDAKDALMTANTPSPRLAEGDAARISTGGDLYNWLTGTTDSGEDY